MFESTLLPERIYGLSLAGGRRSVRPGETLLLRFRIRNVQPRATVPARLRFVVPQGWTALDPAERELPVLDEGEDHAVEFRTRADGGDEADAAFQVVLSLLELTLGSNVVRVAVRGRPRLDGPASALRLAPGEVPDRFDAVVEIRNEGDAVARSARVVVPPPPGFVSLDGVERAAGEIAVGASFSCRFALRAHDPPASQVRIDDAFVAFEGGRVRLRTGEPLVLEPILAPPLVALARAATRLDVSIRFPNDGWIPARDIPCRLELPSGWRALRGTLVLDGSPVDARTQGGALTFAIPLVPAHGGVELQLAACATRSHAGGVVRVAFAEQLTSATIPLPARRSVRLDVRAATAWAGVAETVPIDVALWNDGETDEAIALSVDDVTAARVDLRAGRAARAALAVRVPAGLGDGASFIPSVAATGADGARLATGELLLRLVESEPAAPVAEPLAAPSAPPRVEAAWDVAASAAAGTPLEVRLQVRVADAVDTLRILPVLPDGALYVAGSSRVNGVTLVDAPGGPPLFAADGLTLHDIPAATAIAVGWTLVPGGSGDVTLAAVLDADGAGTTVSPTSVAVDPFEPFAVRPREVAFHIDAATLVCAEPPAALPSGVALPVAAPIGFALRLDPARCGALARMLRGGRGSAIVAHLPLIAGLFPDLVDGNDAERTAALTNAGDAVRSVYERLFVKLRIPGYDVTPYDLEDAAMRDAVVTLLDDLAGPSAHGQTAADLRIEFAPAALRDARSRLVQAPLGGIDGVATAAMLVPRSGTGTVAAALGAYAALLAEELETARSLAHDAFAAYVTMHRIDALDAARERALAALAPVASLA